MQNSCTAIIILNFNNYEDTINCIQSVEKYNTSSVKYIVVDNGSSRPNVVSSLDVFFQHEFKDSYLYLTEGEKFPERLPYLTFLSSPHNDGYARGNNKGLRIAEHDDEITRILILNNDILFIDDFLPRLIGKYNSLSDCAVLSPVLYKKNMEGIDYNCARRAVTINELIKKNFFHYVYRAFHRSDFASRFLLKEDLINLCRNRLLPIDLPSGSCMLIDKELFQKIGYFDPNTFLYYEEDILHSKISKLCKKNYLDLDSRCIHLGAVSTNKSPSIFIFQTNLASEKYYVMNYMSCNKLKKLLYLISQVVSRTLFIWQKKFSVLVWKKLTPKVNENERG